MSRTDARNLTLTRALLIVALFCTVFSLLIPQSAAAQTGLLEKHYLPYLSPGIYNCQVIAQTPVDGSFVLAGEPVPVAWTIRNLSDKTWLASSVNIRHVDGVGSSGGGIYNLMYDVSPEGDYIFTVTLDGPSYSGDYSSNWGIFEGETALCRFYIQFRVP